jgi:phosphatidylinositol 3-kinase
LGRKKDAAASTRGNPEVDPPSSVAKAGLTKYESLRRLAPDSSKKGSTKDGTSNNPIQDYLRSFAYDLEAPYMIHKQVMETYVKSCAGYCVITYVLGVGDRHLDNLLLHQSGRFFHCDYSFILGNDPKKYLPLRMTQDMVHGMGGRESDNFAMFLSLTCAAFLTFRRPENARHLLSLVRLMEGCSLPDVEETQTIEAAILGIRERLRLDLTEDKAISFMEKLIEESCSSRMWMAVDAMHSLGKRF